MRGAHAVRIAVRAYVEPNTTRNLATGPIPSHVIEVLKLAARSEEALAQWSEELNMPPERLVDIAVFFIEQVLMTRDATYYRVLGVNPDAPGARLRSHYQWLMRWLHPDKARSGWHSVLAQRVTRAYNELKDPERRAAYDATLRLPGTDHLRSTVPSVDDFEGAETIVLETLPPAVHRPPDRDATSETPTVSETVAPPEPVIAPPPPPRVPAETPPAWVPDSIAASRPWESAAPPRRIGRFVAVAGVLLVAIVALGIWLAGVRHERSAAPATTAATAPEPTASAAPATGATPETAPGAATPAASVATAPPAATPAPATAAAATPPPRPAPTSQQARATREPTAAPPAANTPAPTEAAPLRAKAQPGVATPRPTETPPKPRRVAAETPAAGTAAPVATPPSATQPPASAPPAAAVSAPPAATVPATVPGTDPAAAALALRIGQAYAAGDFLTVLNLVNRGERQSAQDLAATAAGVQDWAQAHRGQALSVGAVQPLPPAAGGTEPRSEIDLKTADGAALGIVVRRVDGEWRVERVTPNIPPPPGAGPTP